MSERIQLRPQQEERIAEIISNVRKQPLKDEQAQRLYEHWIQDAPQIPSETKDRIGILWMTKILGVSDDVADRFIEREDDAWSEVGNLHSGLKAKAHDAEGFWRETDKLVPDFLSEKDLNYLISVDDDGSGAWSMICTFDNIGMIHLESASSVLRSLGNNAHVYK